MTAPLNERGIATVAVPLPSCGETGGDLGDLYADVTACQNAIADAYGPIILCGHSYGGMVITEAGADDRVTQLLYVTSVMADSGQSQGDLVGSEPAPWLDPSDDGTIGVRPRSSASSSFRIATRPRLRALSPDSHARPSSRSPSPPADRVAAEALGVRRLHRGSRHAGRDRAPTRATGHPVRRLCGRTPPVPLTP